MTVAKSLTEGILAQDVRSIARAITAIENHAPAAGEILKSIYGHTGRGLTIGITGPPGAGKSTFVDKLALHYRSKNQRVGIICVDPSSPFSGGAILGDRIRMSALSGDRGIYIRSMATRGALGGLSRATVDAVAVLDAGGYDIRLVETVGVGQDEVDIVKAADLSVVVLVPGMGDDIQAVKAGIMEIADIFVINKADRDGVERTERELISLLDISERYDGPDTWRPPIVRTVAVENKGIAEFSTAVDRFDSFRKSHSTPLSKRIAAAENRLIELLRERLLERVLNEAVDSLELKRAAESVANLERDPWTIVDDILAVVKIEK